MAFMVTECKEVFLGDQLCKNELISHVLETVPASIIRVDVMSSTATHCTVFTPTVGSQGLVSFQRVHSQYNK
jgi:hypothetical protein